MFPRSGYFLVIMKTTSNLHISVFLAQALHVVTLQCLFHHVISSILSAHYQQVLENLCNNYTQKNISDLLLLLLLNEKKSSYIKTISKQHFRSETMRFFALAHPGYVSTLKIVTFQSLSNCIEYQIQVFNIIPLPML